MYRKYIKRIFDIVSALVLLVFLSPVIVSTAIISWFTHKGDIFFLQDRMGRGYKKFKVIKFKTMTDARDKNGNLLPDAMRVTRFGNFMRNHSLDELLQLLNVLKGDMSLVGPRPLIEQQVMNCSEEQLRRFEVRPGITGLAQVCGRNGIPFARRFRYDAWYVKNLCFVLDFKVLVMTAKAVLGIDSSRNIINYDPLMDEE